MMEETPTKVVSLLGVALTSLAFLFVVSATDASFSGSLSQLPDPFAPEKVVTAIDNVAASYSTFVAVNFLQPAQRDLALAADSVAWVASNATDGALALVGVSVPSDDPIVAFQPRQVGSVAGAHTDRAASGESKLKSGLLDAVYSLLKQYQ